MTAAELLEVLLQCNDPQLDVLTGLLPLNAAFLPGSGSPPGTRATAIVKLIKQQRDGLTQLEAALRKLGLIPDPIAQPPPVPPPTPPRAPAGCILILAANPLETDPLQLDQELNLIRERLGEGPHGTRYQVQSKRAVRATEVSRYLLEYEPVLVHFGGHGSPTGELILEDDHGSPLPVPVQKLADLFHILQGKTECVVLNACYSGEQADSLARYVGCVVGMAKEIGDASALRFAAGFYRGLGFGKDYRTSFLLGRHEIGVAGLPDDVVPHFRTRDEDLVAEPTPGRSYSESRSATPPTQLSTPVRTWVKVEAAAPPPQNETAPRLYRVWYGTNRKPVDPDNSAAGFGAERDDQAVHHGYCDVAVPKAHKFGSVGSWWLKRWLTLTDDRLKLKALHALADEAAYWKALRGELATLDPSQRQALVFLHGYSVSFEAAALRAAQIGYDLKVPGVTAFFSWPSQGRNWPLRNYTADEASIEASEQAITKFLVGFAQSTGAERVHVIAHSMGNRGLLRAVQQIVQQAAFAAKKPFGQIILAAPDVDTTLFRNLAGAYGKLAERTTLYLSNADWALSSSGFVHKAPRAGYVPPVTVLPDMDSVDVTNADLTFLGHGYYGAAEDVLHDMHLLLWHNAAPADRPKLRPEATADGRPYWRI